MFARRQEQELAEIKALALELSRGVAEGEGQLAEIRSAQDRQLAARGQSRRSVPPDQRRRQSRRSVAPDRNGDDRLLAFVHIPKTAGATVISMFAAAYSRQGVRDAGNYLRGPEKTVAALAKPEKMEGRVLAGHVPYSVLREHTPQDTRYMTFLREPVDRVISHYFRHIFAKDPRIDKAVRRPNRSRHPRPEEGRRVGLEMLEEGLVERSMPELNNLSTRFLCDDAPMGELPASAVDDAKANLSRFTFIGIQERFEESLVLLQRMLGLDSTPYQDRHVSLTGSRPTVDELPDQERRLIEEHNQLDAELYRFAQGLFEEAVAATGDEELVESR
jgi:hypothetical protein